MERFPVYINTLAFSGHGWGNQLAKIAQYRVSWSFHQILEQSSLTQYQNKHYPVTPLNSKCSNHRNIWNFIMKWHCDWEPISERFFLWCWKMRRNLDNISAGFVSLQFWSQVHWHDTKINTTHSTGLHKCSNHRNRWNFVRKWSDSGWISKSFLWDVVRLTLDNAWITTRNFENISAILIIKGILPD